MSALFILKLREDYSSSSAYEYSPQIATGMWSSSMFVSDVLNQNGIVSNVQAVHDGNSIDGAVMALNPTHVFIEGLWVVPSKIQELMSLPRHSGRTWILRIHSEIPFLATEGIAISWISEYIRLGAIVAVNADRAHQQIQFIARNLGHPERAQYLPNCYPVPFELQRQFTDVPSDPIRIACFGAFRQMKNHLQQAFAALKFAQYLDRDLEFHVNDRIDSGGIGVSKNVNDLFTEIGGSLSASIVVHDWEDRATFLTSLRSMDLSMQVSITETFNIVAADSVYVDTPILTSNEVPWTYPVHANPQSVDDILAKTKTVWKNRFFLSQHQISLRSYAGESARLWVKFVS